MIRKNSYLGFLTITFLSIIIFGCVSTFGPYKSYKFSGEYDILLSETWWQLFPNAEADTTNSFLQFKPDGKVNWYNRLTGKIDKTISKNSTWERNGKIVNIVLSDGKLFYECIMDETNTIIQIIKMNSSENIYGSHFKPHKGL